MNYEEETTDLRARIRELEAELRQLKAPSGQLALQNTCGDCSVYHGIGHAQGLKADMQKIGIERADALLYGGQQRARAERAEARVAELEGIYEAEACPVCGITQVAIWAMHQSVHHEARELEAELAKHSQCHYLRKCPACDAEVEIWWDADFDLHLPISARSPEAERGSG